jgi:hypothetical protein
MELFMKVSNAIRNLMSAATFLAVAAWSPGSVADEAGIEVGTNQANSITEIRAYGAFVLVKFGSAITPLGCSSAFATQFAAIRPVTDAVGKNIYATMLAGHLVGKPMTVGLTDLNGTGCEAVFSDGGVPKIYSVTVSG